LSGTVRIDSSARGPLIQIALAILLGLLLLWLGR
jgi:hypothetical protein